MASFYRCDGVIGTTPQSGMSCSTGWVQVSEPVFTLVSEQQAQELAVALFALFGVIGVYKVLGRIF